MGSGFSKMKKQARLMQEQYSQMKTQMENTAIEGTAGGGLVKVTINGAKELKKIVISPDCISDIEGLQDLILGALENAYGQVSEEDAAPKMPWM